MPTVERSNQLPPCSRCGGRLMMSADAPQTDQYGRPIHMELCPVCDAGDVNRPAAGLLIQFFAEGAGQDPNLIKEGARLLVEWTEECMAAHGWYLNRGTPGA